MIAPPHPSPNTQYRLQLLSKLFLVYLGRVTEGRVGQRGFYSKITKGL